VSAVVDPFDLLKAMQLSPDIPQFADKSTEVRSGSAGSVN